MNADKLKDIIARKNQRLEDNAVATAEELIENIMALTEGIKEAEKQIAENREALKKLEIQSVNAQTILGEA